MRQKPQTVLAPPKPTEAATERGRRTRHALMDAALDLMLTGRSFASLSIREVTRQAGIVPTAFYRHFQGMDELGLAMVDDCGRSLRQRLSEIRKAGLSSKDIIRHSVTEFQKYVDSHPKYFLVVSSERYGGSPLMRQAIRAEIDLFVDEMVEDVMRLQLLSNMAPGTLRNVCELVVNTMLSASSEFLDLHGQPANLKRRIDGYIHQLRIIWIGADAWQEGTAA
jgi:AcrR family transcriptional regulator